MIPFEGMEVGSNRPRSRGTSVITRRRKQIDAGGPEQDFENPLVKGRASRYHGAKSKPQDVPERGENLTGTRHPSRQAMEEEGAEGPVSLDK